MKAISAVRQKSNFTCAERRVAHSAPNGGQPEYIESCALCSERQPFGSSLFSTAEIRETKQRVCWQKRAE
jgi:hypothetical protein